MSSFRIIPVAFDRDRPHVFLMCAEACHTCWSGVLLSPLWSHYIERTKLFPGPSRLLHCGIN